MQNPKEIVFKIPPGLAPSEPSKPSAFELGVVEQLQGLASEIDGGFLLFQFNERLLTAAAIRMRRMIQRSDLQMLSRP